MRRALPLAILLAGSLLLGCSGTKRTDGGTGPLPVGTLAPDLSATDQSKHLVKTRKPGAVQLIYFYPKDGTPGCTKEACALRDAWNQYKRAGIDVVGVSADSKASHTHFAKEHELPFSLVADVEHQWCKAFGVPSLGGFDKRMSFLIDRDGKVAKIYADVDPGVHADEVLTDAKALGLAK